MSLKDNVGWLISDELINPFVMWAYDNPNYIDLVAKLVSSNEI